MTRKPLGRHVPPDWTHVDRYPLATEMARTLPPSPAVMGVNWYPAFDEPVRDTQGHWWVEMPPPGQRPRGGHCVALKQRYATDTSGWWDFYDQGSEGACVGFGSSRMMSLLNRKRYFARWLWDRAKEVDPWSDTNPGDDEGTLVRSALDVLRKQGHVPWQAKFAQWNTDGESADAAPRASLKPSAAEGIAAYRWVRSIDDLLEVLGYGGLDYVDVTNSWGRAYPHLVRFPAEVIERLWQEDGELGVVTDR